MVNSLVCDFTIFDETLENLSNDRVTGDSKYEEYPNICISIIRIYDWFDYLLKVKIVRIV